jgi:homocysteine S-methyltransferase
MSGVTLLDGGTGRELRRIGAPFRQPEWSALALLDGPEFVTRVHAAFIAAGADVITTNSYAVVPFHLGAERFASDGARLAELAGRLARDAAATAGRGVAGRAAVRVAGSLPPICGSYRADWFDPVFSRPILTTLVEALRPSIDHWQAETLSSVAEAELVRGVIGADGKPLWLSFTLRDDAEARLSDPCLRSGEPVAAAIEIAQSLGAEALLFNCSQPEVMGAAVSVAAQLLSGAATAEARRIRVGVYANAFENLPQEAQANQEINAIRADLTPRGYLAWVDDWIDRGARIVGGCCGIGPEHIRAIRDSLG